MGRSSLMWRERESSRESALEKIKLRDEHSYTLPQKRNSAKTANTLICNQSEYFLSNPCVIVPLRDLVSPSRRAVQQPPPACRAARGFRSGINRGPRRPCQRRLIKFAALDPMRGSGRRLWRREVAVVAQTRTTTACRALGAPSCHACVARAVLVTFWKRPLPTRLSLNTLHKHTKHAHTNSMCTPPARALNAERAGHSTR